MGSQHRYFSTPYLTLYRYLTFVASQAQMRAQCSSGAKTAQATHERGDETHQDRPEMLSAAVVCALRPLRPGPARCARAGGQRGASGNRHAPHRCNLITFLSRRAGNPTGGIRHAPHRGNLITFLSRLTFNTPRKSQDTTSLHAVEKQGEKRNRSPYLHGQCGPQSWR